jgi:Ca-activated chloride channel family protein
LFPFSGWLFFGELFMKSSDKKIFAAILLLLGLFVPLSVYGQSSTNLTIHYVEGVVSADRVSQDVSVYLSVLDGVGSPIDELDLQDFTLTEDSRPVEIDSLELADNEPISVVLLIDTSGSMAREKIVSARSSASAFVSGLRSSDQAAIVTFNKDVDILIDFTNDFDTVKTQLETVTEEFNAGTCLYDAVYQAVGMASTIPSGRRAIVLLTDGMDMTYEGRICSTYALNDVINLASEGTTRVPIYAVGLGDQIDQAGLKRLASTTGGGFLYSPGAEELETLYTGLLEQLKTQYLIQYISQGAPGSHILTVEVEVDGNKAIDTRSFMLPALPTSIQITAPSEGQEVFNQVKIQASVIAQGESISQIYFEIDGQGIGTVKDPPFMIEWDLSRFMLGELTISAIAQGENIEEIARDSITVLHQPPPTEIPTVVPTRMSLVGRITSTPTPAESGSISEIESKTLTTFLWILVPLILVVIIGGYLFSKRRKPDPFGTTLRSDSTLEKDDFNHQNLIEATVDDIALVGEPFGHLTVLYSDDPSMINQVFIISKTRVLLGRSADNDFMFPKDNPVSRLHAVIERQNNQLVLFETQSVDANGNPVLPKYGTFIKSAIGGERQISTIPEVLKTGDQIRLGSRTKLLFNASTQNVTVSDSTLDEFEVRGDDEFGTIEVNMD